MQRNLRRRVGNMRPKNKILHFTNFTFLSTVTTVTEASVLDAILAARLVVDHEEIVSINASVFSGFWIRFQLLKCLNSLKYLKSKSLINEFFITECVQCPSNWQIANGECHPECPEGFYKSRFGCQKCHHYCKACDGAGPLSCTSCPPHFMLDGGLCMECLGQEFYDTPTQTCKKCHDSCRSCSGPGQYSCLTCAYPLHFDRLNNQCVPCCPTDTLPEDQSCCHCDKDTGNELFRMCKSFIKHFQL